MYKPFFNKYLSELNKHRLFIIAGENDYFRYESKKYLIKHMQEYSPIIIESPTLNDIETEINSFDLFSDKKFIIFENFDPLSTKGNKKIEDNQIVDLMKMLSESDHIVLFYCDDKIDKRKKVSKELINISHYIECAAIQKKELIKFLEYLNEEYKTNIPKDVLMDLSVYLDENELFLLSKEFEKLSLFKEKITKLNIYDLLSIKNTHKIFDLMDKVFDKKIHEAIEIYESLLFNKESEYVVYHFIANQFSQMLKLKMIKQDNLMLDIPKTLEIHPFVVTKLDKASRSFSIENLISMQHLLLETDLKIKQGLTSSVEAVKYLIIRACNL